MVHLTTGLLGGVAVFLLGFERMARRVVTVAPMDEEVDELRAAIVTYLADLGQHDVSAEQSAEVRRLLAATDELDAIGDVVEQGLVRLGHRRIDEHIEVSPSTVEVFVDDAAGS